MASEKHACMLLIIILSICAIRITCASTSTQWLQKAEVYNGWYSQWDDEHLAQMHGISFVIGVPPDKAIIDKAHKAGIRVLPYVTFYQAPSNQIYQHADIAEHPDWTMILSDGKEALSIFAEAQGSDNRPEWRAVCRNSPGYWKYALKFTKFMMEQGVDGIFVDNVFDDPNVCEGPKFGRHQHKFPDKDHYQVYHEFLKAVRAEVKKFGDDKILIANTCGPHPQLADVCDGEMLESYICTWAEDHRWHDEAAVLNLREAWSPVLERGCQVLTLSYLGHTKNPVREDAFYCYAWVRISGFIWADWFTGGKDSSILFKLRLGKPVAPMETGEGYYARKFERGLAVVSSENRGADLTLGADEYPRLYDVFEARHLKPNSSGRYEVKLGPGQGRVFLLLSAD